MQKYPVNHGTGRLLVVNMLTAKSLRNVVVGLSLILPIASCSKDQLSPSENENNQLANFSTHDMGLTRQERLYPDAVLDASGLEQIYSATNPPPPLNESKTSFDCSKVAVTVNIPPNIPPAMLQAAICGEIIYKTPPEVTLAILKIECNYGNGNAMDSRNPNAPCSQKDTVNMCGAAGPGQFTPAAWGGHHPDFEQYKCRIVRDGNRHKYVAVEVGKWPIIAIEPTSELSFPSAGRDGNGDNIADPYDPFDSTFSTAGYMGSLFKITPERGWPEAAERYNGGAPGNRNERATNLYAKNFCDAVNSLGPQLGADRAQLC